MATVVLHITKDGFDLMATPDVDRVFWVDENIPRDRCFESRRRYTEDELLDLIGDSPIGNVDDGVVDENMERAIIAKLEPGLRLVTAHPHPEAECPKPLSES